MTAGGESVTRDELIRAVRGTGFPHDPSSPGSRRSTLPSLTLARAEEIVDALFQSVQHQRDEARRWVAGSLYAGYPPGADSPWVYQRGSGCWFAVNGGERYDDGDLDTTSFRRLIPESADGPVSHSECGNSTPHQAHTYNGGEHCPGEGPAADGCCLHPGPLRRRATDAEH
jgi:hypothetical protein